jgi:glycosyltransferase involved in cell wall biosynthesis
MRIVMLHHDDRNAVSGAVTMARRTAAALARRGHEVALAGTAPAAHGSGIHYLGPELPISLEALMDHTGWRPDVVHVTDLAEPAAGWCGVALARAAGCAFAVTPATHSALWSDLAGGMDVARSADVVFVLTAAEGDALTFHGVAPERLAPLGQGAQLSGRADPAAFRAATDIRGPLVLFLGRRLPSKGYQHLLAAAPAILAHHPDATIMVAGPASDPGSVAATRVAPVRDVGELDDATKHSALAAADLLCLPTVADAFPLVFVEAWWCGTPVVSGPFTGVHDVVRDGVDGLVVPAERAAVACAVSGLLADPPRLLAMGRAGRHRAEREFSWAAVAAGAERGYERVAASNPGGAVPRPMSSTT